MMLPKLTDSTINVGKNPIYNTDNINRETSIYHPDRSVILETDTSSFRKSTAKVLDASVLHHS